MKAYIRSKHDPILTFWHSEGLNDHAISQKMGFAQETIRTYRQRLKLPHIKKVRTQAVMGCTDYDTRQIAPWPSHLRFD